MAPFFVTVVPFIDKTPDTQYINRIIKVNKIINQIHLKH